MRTRWPLLLSVLLAVPACQGDIGDLNVGQGQGGSGAPVGPGTAGSGGPINPAGAAGATGASGAAGLAGASGVAGISGTAGATGAAGATGIGGATGTAGATGAAGIGAPPPLVQCTPGADPGVTPLTRLSALQYRNTVRGLLAASGLASVETEIAQALAGVPDDSTLTFRGMDNRISIDHIQTQFNVAVAIGNAIESNATRLTAVAGTCAMTAPLSATCVDNFLAGFGRRAFRRPLSAEELTSFRALNDGQRTPAEAIRAMVVQLLMSPRFVNHLETNGTPIASGSSVLNLDGYEIASRLSYAFWQTAPDDTLLNAARDGKLTTTDGFNTELERVFADARTRETLWQFWNEWFHLEKFTGFAVERPALKALAAGENLGVAGHDHYADMVTELRDLTNLLTWQQKGTLADLLTTDVSVTRSADLARLYGVPAWSGSGAYPRLPAGQRAGILQRGALLVSSLEQTNPFHRGAFIRRNILCDALPSPDPNSLPPGSLDPPPVTMNETTRQRFEKKVAGNGLCVGCHGSFSDLGYVMESFDALGRYRTVEKVFNEQTGALLAQLPVNATAVARVQLSDATPVAGPADLNRRIAESGKVAACLSGNYFRFTVRRDPAAGGDGCWQQELANELAKPNVGLADVFKRVALNAAFRQRKVGAP